MVLDQFQKTNTENKGNSEKANTPPPLPALISPLTMLCMLCTLHDAYVRMRIIKEYS